MALNRKDVKLPDEFAKELLLEKHVEFLSKYGDDPDEYEYAMSEFLRNGTLHPRFEIFCKVIGTIKFFPLSQLSLSFYGFNK